jgi:hypothetical protein
MDDSAQEKKSGKGKTVTIVLLLLLLLGSVGSNIFLWNKEQHSTDIALSKIDTLQSLNLLRDSLYNELAIEQEKVANLRLEISLYQGENDSLLQLLNEKESKINSLRALISQGGSGKSYRALKDSIAVFRNNNLAFRTRVDSLLLQNEAYLAKLNEQESTISQLEKDKSTLSKKVNIAAQPNVGPIRVEPQYDKKGIFTPIYKAKKVERLMITFDLLNNKLTDQPINKKYIIRIKNPDGIILSNSNSRLTNIDDVFTHEEDVTFNGTQQKIKIEYNQDAAYKKGKYSVELRDGKEIKHTFSFELL